MLAYIAKRLSLMVPLLIIISFVVFALTLLIPGDPAVSLAGENATPERIDFVRSQLGLDKPLVERYLSWLWGVMRGDLGTSFMDGRTVSSGLSQRLPVSIGLASVTLLYASTVGVTAGVIAGRRAGGKTDRVVTLMTSMGLAIPHFWLGMLLILFVSLRLELLPAVGYVALTDNPVDWLKHLVIPAVALGSAVAAEIARQTRASVCNVMDQEFVRTAYAKGLGEREIALKHVLRPACIPVVTVIGLQAARLLSASVVIEQLFAIPGLGSLAYQSVFNRDFPVLQGVVLVSAVGVLLVNLMVDVTYSVIDPRVRAE